jgi:hypothetical protein
MPSFRSARDRRRAKTFAIPPSGGGGKAGPGLPPRQGLTAMAAAEIPDHGGAGLGRRLAPGDLERDPDEPIHVAIVPVEHARVVRPRLRDSTEFGQQRVSQPGFQEPVQRDRLLGMRLAVELDGRHREHPIDEILRAPTSSDPARIGEPRSLVERTIREHGGPPASLPVRSFRSHRARNRLSQGVT